MLTVASTESTWSGHVGGAATLAVPHSIREVVVDPEEAHQHRQHFLVVRENPKWPRALAVVELLSPANKTGKYAGTYNAKRAKMLASLTHFMEIDLLRGGDNPLRRHFPDLARTPYFVFVARKTVIGRTEEESRQPRSCRWKRSTSASAFGVSRRSETERLKTTVVCA